MKLDKLTIAVFCALLFVLFAYDVWTLSSRGYETTVSWTLYEWAKSWPAIPFAFGFFMGHIWMPNRAAGKS